MKALPFKDDIEREKQREADKVRLVRLRAMAAQLAGDMWTLEASDGRTRVVTRRSTGERELLCTVHADALPHEYELITGAFDLLVLFLDLQDRAAAKVRDLMADLERTRRKETPISSKAAMLCQDDRFQRFLEGKGAGGPVPDKQAADTRLKSLLAISSKTQLDEPGEAQKQYFRLLDDFRAWKSGGGR